MSTGLSVRLSFTRHSSDLLKEGEVVFQMPVVGDPAVADAQDVDSDEVDWLAAAGMSFACAHSFEDLSGRPILPNPGCTPLINPCCSATRCSRTKSNRCSSSDNASSRVC